MNPYIVKSGDTLSRIASMNGMSLSQLLALNPQFASNPNLIKPGQSVILNPAGPAIQTQISPVKTQAQLDAEYTSAAAAHPTLAGNTPDALAYASTTGDFSGLVNNQGKPFSAIDQASAVAQATADLSPYYAAEKTKDTQDTEATLKAKQAEYQKYIDDQATQFQTDKNTQDQTAANQGVLFSGGRAQKLQQLGDTYAKNQAYKQATVGADIGNTARDFGYKYGDTAAQGLSSYYNLSGNTYNPNVATGGVGSSGLSNIYNANQGFQGTQTNVSKSEAQKRAAGLLYNKGNKLIGSGYSNQY